jgi:GT2 family glycosyltransferase
VGPEERLDPVCGEMAASPLPAEEDLPGPAVLGFAACGAVVRRAAYLEAGGFDDVVHFMGEETRLAMDLATSGWGLAYVDEVVAHHHPSLIRDASTSRAARVARNRLLTTVMRRPWPVVARTTGSLLAAGPAGRLGVAHAAARLPRAVARRTVVPPEVEQRLLLLE